MPVVDASVVVDWISPDSEAPLRAVQLLRRLRDEEMQPISAPRLLVHEVCNALLNGIRRRRWSGTAADRAYDDFRSLPVELIDTERETGRAWELSRRYDNFPVYDMVYLALAERLQTQLLTADRAFLAKVHGHPLVVAAG